MAEGQRLVATADIIAIPSLAVSWARAQLPAKLVDAMAQGRAIVASATGPVVWALDGAGVTVPPGDRPALTAALAGFADPDGRRAFGAAARLRAEALISVDAVAPIFETAVRRAVAAPTRMKELV